MYEMYREEHTEAVLAEVANTLNSVKKKVFLNNINVVCLSISIYVRNSYTLSSSLFIIGRTEIKSS